MMNVDFHARDYDLFTQIDEDTCRRECLVDCFCAVAVYNNVGCWKKTLPISNGRFGSYVNLKVLVKVAISGDAKSQSLMLPDKKSKKHWLLLGSTILGSSVLVNFLLIIAISFVTSLFAKRISRAQTDSSFSEMNLRAFSYDELEEATNGFREELGSGAFGVVYKGILQDEKATLIAVKKLNKLLPEMEKKFVNEVKAISHTCHKNLVRILGFCKERTERLLVYEFMSNGTLVQFLFGATKPEWNRRVQIALGIARGLSYLHEECVSQIIHCDIKPQNILLDDNFVPRISDFELAKLMRTDQTRTSTNIRGTRGYVAPEWFKSRSITAKVDVYSFGIMLLEIISCRRNVEPTTENKEQTILGYWVDDCYRDGRLDLVVDGDEEAIFNIKRVERFVKVSLWCIQEDPSLRPTMMKVIQMLEGAVTVPTPPDFGSYISSI